MNEADALDAIESYKSRAFKAEKERDTYKRFLEIIEGELVHDYNPLASKIRGIIQRCKNTIEIETNENAQGNYTVYKYGW